MRRKKGQPVEIPFIHERYNPAHPLLRELVSINVLVNDGSSFDTLLTRVPGIGEEVVREDRSYRVTRSQHERVDHDGRAFAGYHAYLEADILPADEPRPKKKRELKPDRAWAKWVEGLWRGSSINDA